MMVQPELETMAPAERGDLQSARLADLVNRLSASDSDYWRSKLAGVGLGEITRIEDLGSLPLTTKDELREHYPTGMLAVSLEDTVRIHTSAGREGKPTLMAYTANDLEVLAEVNARAIACAGGHRGDVLQIAYGYGLHASGLGLHAGGERLGATIVPSSSSEPARQLELLMDLRARGLCCNPRVALALAEHAQAEGYTHLPLRYGVFGGEPWSEALRAEIERAWSELSGGEPFDACDMYEVPEVIGPGVAAETREGKGALAVFSDHFYPEIIDPDSGQPLERGEPGELVLTTLTKEALPVLRYRTGDITRFVDGPDPSGRTFPRIARMAGRVA